MEGGGQGCTGENRKKDKVSLTLLEQDRAWESVKTFGAGDGSASDRRTRLSASFPLQEGEERTTHLEHMSDSLLSLHTPCPAILCLQSWIVTTVALFILKAPLINPRARIGVSLSDSILSTSVQVVEHLTGFGDVAREWSERRSRG
jgi:hypothetical protein